MTTRANRTTDSFLHALELVRLARLIVPFVSSCLDICHALQVASAPLGDDSAFLRLRCSALLSFDKKHQQRWLDPSSLESERAFWPLDHGGQWRRPASPAFNRLGRTLKWVQLTQSSMCESSWMN